MNYQESVNYILSFADYERLPRSDVVWDLSRFERLLDKLGDPQNHAKTVHIAGTKGKGSSAAAIASILHHSGYRTGLYTSPHLLSILERVQIDGINISEADFAAAASLVRPAADALNRASANGELTTFELLTALAFVHFQYTKVDLLVLETGLGGRLDATNVVSPAVCVLTSISYDHTEVLGNTLTKIATEKAGIVKPGIPVISAQQAPEAARVIENICYERGAVLKTAGQEFTWKMLKADGNGQEFTLKGLKDSYTLFLPLPGNFQLENAACSVAAAEVLSEKYQNIGPESITKGLKKLHWPGRMQTLREKPRLVIDGAHNEYSCQKLVETITKYYRYNRVFLIFGASGDKSVSGMVSQLARLGYRVFVTKSRHPRAVSGEKLADAFSAVGIRATVTPNLPTALEKALAAATPDDLVLVTGSIFIIAEVLEATQGDIPEAPPS
ncbi:bifunctional folylpolyglutamate synthase/dihydrofolate synthase [Chloroflexota bacterium]